MNTPIGIFDSGVGGLTVLSALKQKLPSEDFIYIGDNLHCPYGDKTKEELLVYTTRICKYFVSQGAKIIILACNTTSANVLNELQEKFPFVPIIGVIEPTVEEFAHLKKKNVLVMATHATVESHLYKKLIRKKRWLAKITEIETPKLVPLIESGKYKDGIGDTLHEYLDPYVGEIDSVILGCTHYPIILEQIKDVLGDIDYVTSSEVMAEYIFDYIKMNSLKCRSLHSPTISIYTTGNVREFFDSSKDFFDYDALDIRYLDIFDR
ncbi:MAG: glutamate racemase [Coprobacillus sp.]